MHVRLGQFREDGHGARAKADRGQVSNAPVVRVFAEDGDAVARLDAERLQMRIPDAAEVQMVAP